MELNIAIATHGPLGYLGKFLNFHSPLKFFLGLMDIVAKVLNHYEKLTNDYLYV